MYTITENERRIGRFFQSHLVSFFAFEEMDIRIDYIRRWFKKTQYPIIDQKNGEIIGNYDIRDYSGSWTPYGKLHLGNETYQCEKLNPDVKRRFFKKDSLGHFKVRVGNYSETATYSFKFNHKHFLHSITETNTPFEGQIVLEGNNLLLLFGGLFLVEQVLTFEGSD